MRARFLSVSAVLAATVALGGCGGNARDDVKAKVQQFITATAAKDYKTICEQVLAPALLANLAQGGIRCEQAMQIALQHVKNPSLAIGKITVSGDRASVLTITGAQGQDAALSAIELIKTSGGWRVSGLGSPIAK
jgi:hypothetical protein